MPRRPKDCPIWGKRNLLKLSNHLADIHQLLREERKYFLSKARYLNDPRNAKSMLGEKRMRNDSDDDMSTIPRSDGLESEEKISSSKRMRNESDEVTSIVSNEDIFSSSEEEDGKSSEEFDDSDESENSDEMNESDNSEESDPWGVLLHEAAAELRINWYKVP